MLVDVSLKIRMKPESVSRPSYSPNLLTNNFAFTFFGLRGSLKSFSGAFGLSNILLKFGTRILLCLCF